MVKHLHLSSISSYYKGFCSAVYRILFDSVQTYHDICKNNSLNYEKEKFIHICQIVVCKENRLFKCKEPNILAIRNALMKY